MRKQTWKLLARHKWVAGATIRENMRVDHSSVRRFTATIRGYANWRIWQGDVTALGNAAVTAAVIRRVKEIRDRIDAGNESVFTQFAQHKFCTRVQDMRRRGSRDPRPHLLEEDTAEFAFAYRSGEMTAVVRAATREDAWNKLDRVLHGVVDDDVVVHADLSCTHPDFWELEGADG